VVAGVCTACDVIVSGTERFVHVVVVDATGHLGQSTLVKVRFVLHAFSLLLRHPTELDGCQ